MIGFIKQHPVAFFVAASVHVVFIVVLVLSIDFQDDMADPAAHTEIVKAVAVDENKVEDELKKIKDAERQRQEKLEKLKRDRQKEEKRLADLKKKREAEKRKQIELVKKRKAQEKAEKERLAKAAAEQKALKEKREKEEQRLLELEQKRQQEEERIQRAEQEERERQLKQKLEEEERRLSQLRSKQKMTEINRYRQLIHAEVYRNWIVPAGAKTGMSTELQVRLIPSGEVVTVDVASSSGDPVFDRSVKNAVHKASPLPVPPIESGLFEEFRQLRLTLKKKT